MKTGSTVKIKSGTVSYMGSKFPACKGTVTNTFRSQTNNKDVCFVSFDPPVQLVLGDHTNQYTGAIFYADCFI